jgi:formate hydrogenlyase subunit 4
LLAALDTGSSFEGMGASREALFSALTEPVLMLGFLALARESDVLSLSGILTAASMERPETALVAVSLFIAFLCENSRIPRSWPFPCSSPFSAKIHGFRSTIPTPTSS